MKRIDLTFSIWIFIWFLVYLSHVVSLSPKFAILVALFFNIEIARRILANHPPLYKVGMFLGINVIIKFIPLWITWNDDISVKDIVATFVLFTVYLIWLNLNKTNMQQVYDKMVMYFSS